MQEIRQPSTGRQYILDLPSNSYNLTKEKCMEISKRIFDSRFKELNKRGPFVIQIEGQLNFFSRPYSASHILLD